MLVPLEWYRIIFTFKIYLGEDETNADNKLEMSLRHFPFLIHDFHVLDKRVIDTDKGIRMQLELDLGLKPGVDIDDMKQRFECVTHLHDYQIIEEEA